MTTRWKACYQKTDQKAYAELMQRMKVLFFI